MMVVPLTFGLILLLLFTTFDSMKSAEATRHSGHWWAADFHADDAVRAANTVELVRA